MNPNGKTGFGRVTKATHQSPAARRRRMTAVALTATLFGAGFILPASGGSAGAVLPVNEPPVTGTIVSFPSRDMLTGADWSAYPFVDVQVMRNGQEVGVAHNVVPDAGTGLVQVNHPGSPCWENITPNIVGGDVIRLTALDANHVPVVVDQTTTAKINITTTIHQTAAGRVEMSGTAFNLDGSPMAATQLQAGALSGSKALYTGGAFAGKRVLLALGTDTIATDGRTVVADGAGNWTAVWTNLNAVDMVLALNAQSQISWAGGGLGSTIFEVGPAIAAGPFSAACPPLAGPTVSTDKPSVEFAATTVGASSDANVIHVTNTGVGTDPSTELVISSVTSTSNQFSVVSNTCAGTRIVIGAGCDISVVFSPTSSAPSPLKTGLIEILSNAGNSTVTLNATGYALNAGQQAAVLVAKPANLDFGTRPAGNTSLPETLTITNYGNVSAINATGTFVGSTEFAGTAGCAEILPSQSCTGGITFTPAAEGPRSGTLNISSSFTDENGAAGTAAVAVQLSGAGLITNNIVPFPHAPIALNSFLNRDFVSLLGWIPGEALTVQVIRQGVVVGSAFNVIAHPDGIAEVNHPGGQCWEGTTPDLRAGDVLRVTRGDGSAYEMTEADVRVTQKATETFPGSGIVEMKGWARDLATGGPFPRAQLDARLISSTAIPFAITGRRALTAADTATHATLAYDPISATNPDGVQFTATWDFNASSDVAGDVALAASQQNRVMWLGRQPLALAELTFAENSPFIANGPTIPCTAPAEAPSAGIAVMTSSNVFPTLGAGDIGDRTYTIRNVGTTPLVINSITFGGSNPEDFSLVGAVPAPIAPESNGTFTVRFSPQVVNLAGTRSAIIRINDNAVGSPHTATATGLAVRTVVPSSLLTPAALTFADTQVGLTTGSQVVTVSNEGAADLTFAGISVTNTTPGTNAVDFHVVGGNLPGACNTTAPVHAGSSCTITATFTPSAVNTRTANLTISSNDPLGDKSVALTGTSSISAEGAFDPPRLPHAVSVFPVRDYVLAAGYTADEVVTIEAYRNGVLIGQSDALSPRFPGGLVEANHVVSTGCWANATPDLRAGDVIRAVARQQADPSVINSMDQIHVQGIEVNMPATAVNANTVVMTGTAVDTFTGLPLAVGSFEPRITTKTTGNFTVSGRQDLRAAFGLDGSVTMNGSNWTATFTGLTPADVQLAVTGLSHALWLGRIPLALNENSHAEWAEIPGPTIGCPVAGNLPALAPIADVTVAPVLLDAGFSGSGALGVASTTNVATFTNVGPGAISGISVGAVEGLNPGDFTRTTNCPATLAVGARCTVTVAFKASANGVRAASIPITHSGQNGISHIVVSGVGVPTPTLTAVAPASAVRGTSVTLTGTDLAATTSVSFTAAGQAAQRATSFTIVNNTTVTAVIPANLNGATDTPVATAVSVTTQGGTASKAGGVGGLTVAGNPPTITSTLPTAATGVNAGSTVKITGTSFNPAVGATTVTINGAAATVSVPVACVGTPAVCTISVIVPLAANTTGAVITNAALVVRTTNGTATVNNFKVNPSPTLTSFSVVSAARGTAITLRGVGFTAASTVTFTTATGDRVAAAVTAATRTSTALTVTVPATAVQGPVTVSTTGFTPSSLEFVVATAPTITSFTPTAGPADGTSTITVTGNNFRTATKVSVGGKAVVAFTVTSPTTLVISGLAKGTTSGTISVQTSFGTVLSAASFTVVVAPTITTFTPTTTSLLLNPVITVVGTNFVAGSTVTLVQGTRLIPTPAVLAANGTSLTFRLAVGTTVGLYNIRVSNVAASVTSVTNLNVTP